ncbi:MAG TPA: LuxR C-terminal-related transcriptional regulator [Aldersonia sp.]
MQSAEDGFTPGLRLRASRPAVPPGFVRRARLDVLLSKGVTGPVTVVSAGPGFGKTLTVAGWARLGTAPGPIAWLLADEADEVQAFWTQVLGALTVADALPSDNPLRALLPGTEFGLPEVARIADELDRLPEPVVIVIDDFHRITDPAVLESVSHLLDRRPSKLRLVLVTRTEPKLRLRRLQLAGDLTEIHADALTFTESETHEFCARSGFDLTADEIAMLVARTQGWPAGLRLALLGIDRNDVHAGLQRFSGRSQLVAAYLIEELLETLAPTDRRFLLATSVVEQVSGGLARALTGRADSHEALERLVANNALTVRLADRPDWFSYHPLLRQLLRSRLAAEQPDSVIDLHRRAAVWFTETGDPITAIRHLAAARDWPAITRVLGEVAIPLVVTPHATALAAALVPAHAEAARHPTSDTLLAAAVCEYRRRNYEAMRRNVDDADVLLAGASEDTERAARLMIALVRMAHSRTHNPADLLTRAEQVLDLVRATPREHLPAADGYAVIGTTNRAIGLTLSGRLDEGEAALQQIRTRAHDAGLFLTEVAATSYLAVIDVLFGRIPIARDRTATAAGLADQRGWSREPQTLATYAAAALTCLEANDLTRVDEWIEFGLATATPGSDSPAVLLLEIASVTVAVARGNVFAATAAAGRLRAAREVIGRLPDLLERWTAVAQAHAALLEGRPESVLVAVEEPGNETGYAPALERIVLAKAHLATSHARAALDSLGPPARFAPYRVLAAEAAVLGAVAAAELRRDAVALERITAAIELAQPIGAVRPFVTAGARVSTLLNRYQHVVGAHSAFIRDLLTACGTVSNAPAARSNGAAEPLTERERVVLHYLPTMFKTSEIASDLFVSVNTVKTHQQSIYRKLGVSTRRDAVDRARELDLLP